MARTIEFDKEATLERALALFRSRGYEATSLDDLLQAMDIGRSSFYNTFGGKHDLVLLALDRYVETVLAALVADLRRGSALDAIQRTLTKMIGPAAARGCFLHKCALELAGRDAAVKSRVREGLGRLERGFGDAIARGQEAGEIRRDLESSSLAKYLVGNLYGLELQARAGTSSASLQRVVRMVLQTLQ